MRVRIYRPAKSALQSRCGCDALWVIEPVLETPREREPLMGWTSANDPLSSLSGRMTFATSGEALTFASERGWDYEFDKPNDRRVMPKNYTDNFRADRRRSGRGKWE